MVGDSSEPQALPSVGAIGTPYVDIANNRVKYFSRHVHKESQTLQDDIEQAKNLAVAQNVSRLTMRAFVNGCQLPSHVEAKIELGEAFPHHSLIYYAENAPERRDCAQVVRAEILLREQITRLPATRCSLSSDYQLFRLHSPTDEQREQLVSLYAAAYPTYTAVLDGPAINTMAASTHLIVAQHKTDGIVAAAAGEVVSMNADGRNISLCEISEVATRSDHRKKNLAKSIVNRLTDTVPASIIYAEARASSGAMNRCFFDLGYTFAGMLEKHCVISGDCDVKENGPYENLNVWYTVRPR